jgi:hypothetical protein
MTPKEKAIELWGKYFQLNYDWDGVTKDQWAKEGALIAVDETINSRPVITDSQVEYNNYWQEVKQEIEKL